MAAPRRYEEHDADPALLRGRRVAVLGYGNQGHAHALNLRDSGVEVVVGARPGGRGAARAREDGFEPRGFAEATRGAALVMLTLPDDVQGPLFEAELRDALDDDAVLAFAHGFAVAFGMIELPPGRQAILVAPKGQGHKLREAFVAGGGLPGLVAAEGGDREAGLQLALAYAHGIGALAGGARETSFREEAVTDQFGEQAVLCGGLTELITAGWETLVDAGYDPEVAYFECLHEVKLIVDLLHAQGVDGMRERISSTAAHGGLRAAPRVIGEPSRRAMRELLAEIEDGRFAREFLDDQAQGAPWLRARMQEEREHPMQATGRGLRAFLDRCQLGPGPTDPQEDPGDDH